MANRFLCDISTKYFRRNNLKSSLCEWIIQHGAIAKLLQKAGKIDQSYVAKLVSEFKSLKQVQSTVKLLPQNHVPKFYYYLLFILICKTKV